MEYLTKHVEGKPGTRWTIQQEGRQVTVTGVHASKGRVEPDTDPVPIMRTHKREFINIDVAVAHYEASDKITGGFTPLVRALHELQPKQPKGRKGA